MKKFWKVTLIPGLFCIFAGLVLAAILLLGFREELIEHADEFSINEDNFFEFFAGDKYVRIGREGTRYLENDSHESYYFAVPQGEPVTGIDFEIAVGEVKISTGETMEIAVTDMFENAISSYVEDGVWYVTDSLIGNGSVYSEYCPEITITMPQDFEIKYGDIYLAAGLMNVDELVADVLCLEVDAGSLKILSLTADNSVVIKNGVGEVKIYDADVKNVSLDNGFGAVSFSGAISGHNVIKCGVGEVKLDLTDRDRVDFNYDITCGIGEVRIDNASYSGNVESSICGYDDSEADYFSVDCGIGYIEIDVSGN